MGPLESLRSVSTATLTTVLLKRGLRNVWMRHAQPVRTPQPRVAGPAFTLRFVPAREDLATPASWASPVSPVSASSAAAIRRRRVMRNGRAGPTGLATGCSFRP